MQRAIFIGVIALSLVGIVYLAMQGQGNPIAEAEATATPLPVIRASSEVVADAVVVPVQHAELSLPLGGLVAEVLVEEGATVEAGELLVRLSAPQQEAALAQAEAALLQSEAALARAEAVLASREAGPRAEELAAAQAGLAATQASLQRLQDGASAEEIAATRAAVTIAQAELDRLRQGPTESELINARTEIEKAERALQQAQAAYDQVKDRADIGALPQSLQLEQATLDYEATQARFEQLTAGPAQADLQVAQARVAQAQANLAQVQAGPRPADLAATQAEIDRAQAQLDLLAAGATAAEIRIAEADVEAAQANVVAAKAGVAQAQARLADAELRAPFAGVVAALELEPGEQVGAGTIIAQVADLSAWRIETDDLTELSVVEIAEGDRALISFDALPELELAGTITRIRPIGENKQGDITYTVLITPEEQDPRLRWNMTATVAIAAED